MRAFQVVQHPPGNGVTTDKLLASIVQRPFQPGSFVADVAQLLDQLGFRPVRVDGQLDVAVFLAFELNQSLPEL